MKRGRFIRKARLGAMSEINVTPLIDLAFALLIIFMIATPLLEQSIEIDLPSESQKPQNSAEDLELQVLSINASGHYYWGKERVEAEVLQSRLDQLSKLPTPPVIDIRADAKLPYQSVITVVDWIKKSGLERIHLDTKVN